MISEGKFEMSELHIIGNGFDKGHRLKTSYWNFREYLEKYEEDFLFQMEKMYNFAPFERKDNRNRKNKQRQKWRDDALYQYLWCSFEFELSHANEVEMEERSQSVLEVMDLDGGLIGIEDTMDDYWEEEYHFIEMMNHYVWKWAKQIRLNKAYPRKTSFIENTEDYFLTFNYTNVLERVYQISSNRICHIHGGLTPYCKEKPILGHGNADKIDMYQEKAKRADDEFDEGAKSIYNAIAKFYERILKDTNRQINIHRDFFENFSDITSVNIIGHSMSNVDLPYFQSVKLYSSDKIKWNIYCYDKDEQDSMKERLLSIGVMEEKIYMRDANEFWA